MDQRETQDSLDDFQADAGMIVRVNSDGSIGGMGIGDLKSEVRGSAARFNSGKPPMELVPARAVMAFYIAQDKSPAWRCLSFLAQWQETGDIVFLSFALRALSGNPLHEAAHVFEYGRGKYAEWNWAKGFNWSVPFACAVRHCINILDGEMVDGESKRPHEGHVACNIIMLLTFQRTYPEGNDMPKAGLL